MRAFTHLNALLSALAVAAAPNQARQAVSGQHGTIVSPTADSSISPGEDFSFDYRQRNWCNAGYSPITVWLTDYEPTTTDLDSNGRFPEGHYTYFFGNFVKPNFGLPPLSGTPLPPSTLNLPALDGIVSGGTLYLSVVELGRDCPPGGVPPQYALTETSLVVQ
ncbi:hypothetical protein VNI00_014150 [Paramarasmius palmivorus]|uniref:Uncharacterized protein n=1 Tax=Paramarasmius palmivorus TaxID=297713 RepID=A0AAW0BUC3_9AGAR